MAWNEPNNNQQKPEGPPDLDKAFKELLAKFNGLFGQKSSGSSSQKGSNSSAKSLLFIGFFVLIALWALSGIFIVAPAEKAVVLQFGRYHSTVESGPHWLPRFIRTAQKVNVQKVSNYSYSAQMLTKDQNIVDVAVAVQYRVSDARQFLFNVKNPNISLQQATASALRQVIGNTTLDQVLTTGRAVVRQQVVLQLNKILKLYQAGIQITDVALQPAQAPSEVKAAFDDAIKAQEDEQRYQNQAEAYANNVVPVAQGRAKRILQEANAYAQQTVLNAQGNVARFDALFRAYKQAPTVTRERLYLDAMQEIMQRSTKVFVDTKGNNNLLYLPLNKLLHAQSSANSQSEQVVSGLNAADNMLGQDDIGASNNMNPDSVVGTRGVRP